MIQYNEVYGDLIKLAKEGKFAVITHGCNCFCQMGAGIAPQMVESFDCDLFDLEYDEFKGDINKLGQIEYKELKEYIYKNGQANEWKEFLWDIDSAKPSGKKLIVINSYTQYRYGRGLHLDYDALVLCLRKINHTFKGKHIGLPQIGCGLAGGDWNRVKEIIKKELKDCKVTVVIFKK
jgi:O-acetyl-ADP-ribose deacetylase (regulator of RNase III)